MPLWERDLFIEEVYVYTFYGLTNIGVCAYMDWVDRSIKNMETQGRLSLACISRWCLAHWFLYILVGNNTCIYGCYLMPSSF